LILKSTLELKWEEAHLNFSRSLIRLLLEYWNNRVANIDQQIQELSAHLKNQEDANEMNHIQRLLAEIPTSMNENKASKSTARTQNGKQKTQ
jgi:hypothetical protein